MKLSKFTVILRSRGWTIEDACEWWGMRTATYYDRCRNERLHNQLESMCKGMDNKMDEERGD